MKTAISIPDDLFASADALAARLGISRSQLYVTALTRLVAEHDGATLTAGLNAVYGTPEADAQGADRALAALQARSLGTPEAW